jgi:cytochrome P450
VVGVELGELARSFNIWDARWADDPYPVLRSFQQGCPVAHSEELGGYWMVTSYEGVRQVLSDSVSFSSRVIQLPSSHDSSTTDVLPVYIPESVDPPQHTAYRQLMTPLLSPVTVGLMEGSTRGLARELLSGFAARGGGEFLEEIAIPLPATVFLRTFGLPLEDLQELLVYRDAMMRGVSSEDPVVAEHATKVVIPAASVYINRAIVTRRAMVDPPEDLLTALVFGRLGGEGGRLLEDDEIHNVFFNFIPAGLDTVTAVLCKTVASLAERPDLRQQLVDDPGLIPAAVEEFLRYWALVTVARQSNLDALVEGVEVPAGSIVAASMVAACRDPREFENPDEIDFKRSSNRHIAFGAGPHRCIGSHLARMELRIALEELLRAMPNFSIDPDNPMVQHFGQVIGVEQLPLKVPA